MANIAIADNDSARGVILEAFKRYEITKEELSREQEKTSELQQEIKKLQEELEDKNVQIMVLEEKLKSEQDKCHKKSCKLTETRNDLDEVVSELEKALEDNIDKSSEIETCHQVISNQKKLLKKNKVKLEEMENSIQNDAEVITGQDECIQELQSEIESLKSQLQQKEDKRVQERKSTLRRRNNQLQSLMEIDIPCPKSLQNKVRRVTVIRNAVDSLRSRRNLKPANMPRLRPRPSQNPVTLVARNKLRKTIPRESSNSGSKDTL